jgi:hypothetical protein
MPINRHNIGMIHDRLLEIASEFALLSKWAAISLDRVMNIHDPDVKRYIGDRTVIVYHGTSSKHLANILRHGSLDPAISRSEKFRSYEGSSYGIFVTAKLGGFTGAELYSHNATEKGGGDRVILEIFVPMSWIDLDPDDTRYVNGEMNDLGANQGIIRKTIDIKRIKSVVFDGEAISQIDPAGGGNIFDRYKTKWMPLGTAIMEMVKLAGRGVELPEEYKVIAGLHLKGLAKSEYKEDIKNIYASKLEELHHTFFDPASLINGKTVGEVALLWLFSKRNALYQNAEVALKDFFNNEVGAGFYDRFLEAAPEEYKPKQYQSLMSFLSTF